MVADDGLKADRTGVGESRGGSRGCFLRRRKKKKEQHVGSGVGKWEGGRERDEFCGTYAISGGGRLFSARALSLTFRALPVCCAARRMPLTIMHSLLRRQIIRS